MILLFGGTTEGRKAAEVLEEAGSAFYYSTKTGEQDITLHHGLRIDGAMDESAMLQFCNKHDIRLIIDAAHPFAQQLHQTIAAVSQRLNLPVVRYERIFPPRDEHILWIDRYEDLHTLQPATILATTGVQSISRLKPLEQEGFRILYRILPRESSVALAKAQGATDDQLCFYQEDEDEVAFLKQHHPDILLVKESGESGGFNKKVQAAGSLGIMVVALKRPTTPKTFHCVNGPHGLRRK
ncbi:MAG: precorrin-6A/cobalt-precorrin-6A reductase, partial [Bacteroidaceae bacterium]|nr:precorrin-6A/cobalt-precorrin-6A reductase [Bacteroidaceae bacterium]